MINAGIVYSWVRIVEQKSLGKNQYKWLKKIIEIGFEINHLLTTVLLWLISLYRIWHFYS